MSNRHTATGRFVAGKSTGTYRGQMRHDPSTEEIKTKLHTKPSRDVVGAHDGQQSVATDAGRKPTVHDCATDCGPNSAANDEFNDAVKPPRETTNPARLVGAGIVKGN
jgi:hypothetical protein